MDGAGWIAELRLRRLRLDGFTPIAVDGARELHQLRAAKAPDAGIAVELQPLQRLSGCVRADADLIDRSRQRLRHRLVRREVLTRRQDLQEVLKIRVDQA